MYCTHCKCASCKALRSVAGGPNRAKEDVVRLVIKSGEKGMTACELKRFSRSLRILGEEAEGLMFDQLVSDGVLIEHMFKPASGRGKSRPAFLFAQVSQ